MSRKEILVAGAGGQGVLFAANILCLAAAQKGKRVVSTPSYGAAVRGGEVRCGVIISDEEIFDPLVDNPDIAIMLNENCLKKFGGKIKAGGIMVSDASEKAGEIAASFGKKFQLIPVPLKTLGPDRYHNMIALGVFTQIDDDINLATLEETLRQEIGRKGKADLLQENLKAIKAGSDWYGKERRK
jgi:2-oxoglutarate ferredoxin oxidoreductase subunit gamma